MFIPPNSLTSRKKTNSKIYVRNSLNALFLSYWNKINDNLSMISRFTSNISHHLIVYVVLYRENKDSFSYWHIVFYKTISFHSLEHGNVKWHQSCEIITTRHDVTTEIKEIQELKIMCWLIRKIYLSWKRLQLQL